MVLVGMWSFGPLPHADALQYLANGNGGQRLGQGTRGRNHAAAPELDPQGAGTGMLLLLGGAAYFASRRREDDDQ